MTRKHFERIANELAVLLAYAKDTGDAGRIDQAEQTIHAMARTCAAFNGDFDTDRFYRACGLV